jgi:hypothetical protein
LRTIKTRAVTVLLAAGYLLLAAAAPGLAGAGAARWPEGTHVLGAENLEGIMLLKARLQSGTSDTSGVLVLDTGAGYLALDRVLAVTLGVSDSVGEPGMVDLAERPLPRLELDGLQVDLVSPVLTVEADVIRRVSDRPVLGLLGQKPLASYIVWIDYKEAVVALLPAGEARPAEHDVVGSRRALPALSPRATAVPFRIAGDGKMLVRARVGSRNAAARGRALTLVFDTGATKTVMFEPAFRRLVPQSTLWPRARGLSAPTLIGADAAEVVRVPELELPAVQGAVRGRDLDVALLESSLSEVLAGAVGEPVHGLLGYSFLRDHRLAIDYPRHLVWLDPLPPGWEKRPYEYSHVGIQVERHDGVMRVVGVVEASPAARAGVRPGDVVTELDGRSVAGLDVLTLMRRLEGPPGSRVSLTLVRDAARRTVVLVRRRLL